VADFMLPTSADLKMTEQALLPIMTQDDPLFKFFPIVDEDAALLVWEQRERYTGLQRARGVGGEYTLVDMVPIKQFWTPFGSYGERFEFGENEILHMRQPGTWAEPISVNDLVAPAQEFALVRRIWRVKFNLWTMITTGTITVTNKFGVVIYQETYALQTFTATTPWSTLATATPVADIRAVQLFGRGFSIDFGAKASLFMNLATFNAFINNNNNADLRGIRLQYGATVNALPEMNKLLMGLNLPEIVIYDETWLEEHPNPVSTAQRQTNLFLPFGKAVLMGKRPGGAPLGNYVQGRNIDNPGFAPGAFMKVADSADANIHPRRLSIYDGHNGAMRIPHPYGVVVLNVA
jgi:hypothetical protein